MKQWTCVQYHDSINDLHIKNHGKHKEREKVEFLTMLMLMVFSIAMELFSKDKDQQSGKPHNLKFS